MAATHFFGKHYKNRFLRNKKKPFWGKKKVELLPARFQGPPKMGVTFFEAFFSSCFSVSSASSTGCSKKPILKGFFEHPSKASSNIMQQQSSKTWTPQKSAQFFLETPFFDQKQLGKTLTLHPPWKLCTDKTPKNPIFIGSKMWPSYWPWGGQVIDLEMAKMWPSGWPYSIYIYIYIYKREKKQRKKEKPNEIKRERKIEEREREREGERERAI